MRYYLRRWRWSPEVIVDGEVVQAGYWHMPGATAVIDMRSIPQQSRRGDVGPAQGWCFCAYDAPVVDPNAVELGASLDSLNDSQRSAMGIALGHGAVAITATSLRQAVWDCLTIHADPNGNAACHPLVPEDDGIARLHLLGHSVIMSKRITQGSPEWPNLRALLQRNYRKIRDHAVDPSDSMPATKHRQYLDTLIIKYRGVPFREFIPFDLPVETPLPHDTSVIDIFDRADQLLSASTDWTHLGPFGDVVRIVSNQLETTALNTPVNMQHQTALSSDDHTAQIDVITLNVPTASASSVTVFTRLRDANNWYTFQEANFLTTGERRKIVKRVGGTFTTLSDVAHVFSLPDTVKGESNGSSQTISIDGTAFEAIVDTALTGDLNIGLEVTRATGTVQADTQADNFSGGDLVIDQDIPIDSLSPLQKAIFDALKANATLSAAPLSGRIFDDIPDNEVFPYVRIGEFESDQWRTMSRAGERVDVFIHVFSAQRGNKEALDIRSAIDQVLGDNTTLTVVGFTFNFMLRIGARTIMEESTGGRKIRHVICRYEARLQQGS